MLCCCYEGQPVLTVLTTVSLSSGFVDRSSRELLTLKEANSNRRASLYMDFATSELPGTVQNKPPIAAMARVYSARHFRLIVQSLKREKVCGILRRNICRNTLTISLLWSSKFGGAEYHILLALLSDGDGALDFRSKYSCMIAVRFCIEDERT